MPRPLPPNVSPHSVLDPDQFRAAETVAIGALLRAMKPEAGEVIEPILDPDQLKEEADRLAKSFIDFIPAAWKLIEPSHFVGNWHIDGLAKHLTAVTKGDILDLLVTMPPRHSKSLIITVLWPVWEWITLPSYRWVFASYAHSLSVRDSIKRRKIIRSQWFKDRWGERFSLLAEQDTKIRYENDKHGFMLATSVEGSNTGEGGERIVADDPHNVKDSESETVRNETVDWWNIVMSTRRNDETKSARVVVQQRTHEGDVAGDIISKGGYVHVNLPTEYRFAGAPKCRTMWVERATGTTHHWEDPREEPGELLNPKRFSPEANAKAKIDLGDYQYAAQHGQNPTPPEGQIIQSAWLKYYGGPNQPPVPNWTRATHPMTPLLSADCTFKEHKDTDFVAMLGWAMFGADVYLMPFCIHKRLSFPQTIDAMAEMVGGESLDGTKTWPGVYPFIKLKVIEDKANGPAIIATLRHKIPGIFPYNPGGASKESRLQAVSWRFRAGNIYIPHESIAPWIVDYRYELCAFPRAVKDDYVDATSQALLTIGGDAVQGQEPIMGNQESLWFGLGVSDFAVGGDSAGYGPGAGFAKPGGSTSLWGNLSGSKWRL